VSSISTSRRTTRRSTALLFFLQSPSPITLIISSLLANAIAGICSENTFAVWEGAHPFECYPNNTGVKQGWLLSPVLFSLYIDDVSGFLPGSIDINGAIIKTFMYAENMALLAETPELLQSMLNKLVALH